MKNTKINSNSKAEEMAVIGSMLINPDVIEEVRLTLVESDFENDNTRDVFSAICSVVDAGNPVDIVSISKVTTVGGAVLYEIMNSVPSSANIKYYTEQVKSSSTRRRLLSMTTAVSDKLNSDVPTLDVVRFIEEEIVDATLDNSQRDAISIKDGITSVMEHIELLIGNPQDVSGIKTGIQGLDKKINGLNKTDLLILAARPGCGKSSLALQIAKHTSFFEDKPTMLFSLEMGTEQLVQRILCNDSKVDLWKIRSGKMEDIEMQALKDSARKLKTSPLFLNDMAGVGIKDIRSQIKLHNAKNDEKIELVIVDYLQLMASGSSNLVQQVTEISRGLKMIAKEFNIPVIALSQLSRAVEARGGKPRLSDLRDSGSIEQDADIVMFLHREKTDENTLGNDKVDLMIEKHRNGSTGEIPLEFNGGKMTFTEFSGDDWKSDFNIS